MQPEPKPALTADDQRIAHARALQAHLEAGNEAEAARVLDELTRMRESALFQELGKLTRDLHEAINSFRYDARLANITEVDIPDAKERLNYVIAMTEQAATNTLKAVEESQPLCAELSKRSGELKLSWERFMRRDMKAEEFRELCRQIIDYLGWVETSSGKVRDNLSHALMAQSFQDLTGQIIRRVITLVEEVEQNLVNLIRISGQKLVQPEPRRRTQDLEGPQVPALRSPDAVSGQDEVDKLLSSLGF